LFEKIRMDTRPPPTTTGDRNDLNKRGGARSGQVTTHRILTDLNDETVKTESPVEGGGRIDAASFLCGCYRSGIKKEEPGDRLIVTEGDAGNQFTGLKVQLGVGVSEFVCGALRYRVSVTFVGSDHLLDLSPTRRQRSPPGVSIIVDDYPRQLVSLGKWGG
jgi:hypothetical protein